MWKEEIFTSSPLGVQNAFCSSYLLGILPDKGLGGNGELRVLLRLHLYGSFLAVGQSASPSSTLPSTQVCAHCPGSLLNTRDCITMDTKCWSNQHLQFLPTLHIHLFGQVFARVYYPRAEVSIAQLPWCPLVSAAWSLTVGKGGEIALGHTALATDTGGSDRESCSLVYCHVYRGTVKRFCWEWPLQPWPLRDGTSFSITLDSRSLHPSHCATVIDERPTNCNVNPFPSAQTLTRGFQHYLFLFKFQISSICSFLLLFNGYSDQYWREKAGEWG